MRFLTWGYVSSHLIFSNPSVWDNNEPLYELERPMTPDTSEINWFCKGHPRKDNAVILELVPGTTLNVPIICGEAPIGSNQEQATQFCNNDRNALHGGGGCSLSIANGDTNDFTIITVAHDCPKLDWSSVAFEIPEGLPEITNGKCSWTWVPPLDFAQQESYNNCFSCSVKSSIKGTLTGGTKLNANPLNTYKDTFANGPLNDWSVIGEEMTTQEMTTQENVESTKTSTPTKLPKSKNSSKPTKLPKSKKKSKTKTKTKSKSKSTSKPYCD